MRGAREGYRRGAAGVGLALLLAAAACGPAVAPPPVVVGGPTDRESVAIAQAANQGEIETSQPAVQRAQSPAVRQFAERMVADHTAANQRLLALGIAPQENEQSRRVTQSARQMGQALEQFPPHAYDRAYMDAQIALHQYTLTMLESYLIPSSRSGRLRTLLEEMRGTVAAHLEQARQIRGTL
jgi:putative membrane protein